MPRYQQPYSIYKRTENGVYYYYTHNPYGERTVPHSTGKKTKAEASKYVVSLIERGLLYTGDNMMFAQYAEHFFDDNSPWLTDKIQEGTEDKPSISKSYITQCRSMNKNYLIPFFGKYKLSDLRPSLTKKFRFWMSSYKQLSNKTINTSIGIFKIIVDTARADGIMVIDPLLTIKSLKCDDKRDAFTLQEIISMFNHKWSNDDVRLFSFVSSITGMRYSEIRGLRQQDIHDDYLDVTHQIYQGEYKLVKTGESRKVPVIKEVVDLLRYVGGDFIFNKGATYYRENFVLNCGIKKEEREERKISFHSFRHFWNTTLIAHNVSKEKVDAVIGHSDGKGSMTARYTNWRPELMPEIYEEELKLLKTLHENNIADFRILTGITQRPPFFPPLPDRKLS